MSAADIFAAGLDRTAFYRHPLTPTERYDFLALPTAQVWSFDVDWASPKSVNGRPMDTYHRWMEVVIDATLGSLLAISVPVGFGAAGLPMRMQLIGRPRADLAVLQLAHAVENG